MWILQQQVVSSISSSVETLILTDPTKSGSSHTSAGWQTESVCGLSCSWTVTTRTLDAPALRRTRERLSGSRFVVLRCHSQTRACFEKTPRLFEGFWSCGKSHLAVEELNQVLSNQQEGAGQRSESEASIGRFRQKRDETDEGRTFQHHRALNVGPNLHRDPANVASVTGPPAKSAAPENSHEEPRLSKVPLQVTAHSV